MKVTKENVHNLPISDKEKKALMYDLDDIEEINEVCKEELFYLYWEENHTEYSCERTDPCPDYYGCFSIRRVKDNELIGLICSTEDELQENICVLYDACKTLMENNNG